MEKSESNAVAVEASAPSFGTWRAGLPGVLRGPLLPLAAAWYVLVERVLAPGFRAGEHDARAFASSDRAGRLDTRVIIVLLTTAVSLTLLEYVGMSNRYGTLVGFLDAIGLHGPACSLDAWLAEWSVPRFCEGANEWQGVPGPNENLRIDRLTYWALSCFTVYFILPSLVIKLVFRERIRDYGVQLKGAFKDWWLYVVLFLPVGVAVLIVSKDPHFQQTYPFYDLSPGESLWPYFWMWEALYFSQFFALEFFFRGFMVVGTRHRFGFYSVLVMMVPYCMIHFGKPMPETIGAIIAGTVLGSLALKSRSIWMGVAIHASVALAMDFAAMWREGQLGGG